MTAGRDVNDRRRSLWRLSAAGERLLKGALPAARKITDATLAPLDTSEQKILIELLSKLK